MISAIAIAERQKVLFVSSPLALLFTLADVGALGHFSITAFAVRVAWSLTLLGTALALPRVTPRQDQLVMGVAAVVSSVCFALLVLLTGGHHSPMFHWILASPLTVAVVVQDYPRATLAAGITTVASGLFVLAQAGQPVAQMVTWAIQACGMSAVAVYASSVYRRLRVRERSLQEQRIADLQALRQLDAERAAKERAESAVKARDAFLAIASHELRTPLTSLKLEVQNLVRTNETHVDSGASYAMAPKLQLVERQADRLTSLLDRLLDVSKIDNRTLSLELELVELGALVKDALARWQVQLVQARCTPVFEAAPDVFGRWDRLRLGQVVDNLLSNAVKFGEGRPILVKVRQEGALAVLSVTDHGIGVLPNDKQRIFGRFERAVSESHYGGLGLGLYVTREIVQALGGEVDVDSTVGQGSTFTVRLPLAGPGQAAQRGVVQ